MTQSEATGPRWQRRKEIRPQAIVEAALELFVRQGYAATRMEQVARHAGITPGTLYLYFAGKEDLLRAVVHESLGLVLAYADRRIEEWQGNAEDMLRELVRGWWELIGRSRFAGIPKLMAAEAGNFPELARFYMTEIVERGRGIFRRAIEYGVRRGEFQVRDLEQTVRVAMAPLQYASIHAASLGPFESEPPDVEGYLEATTELLLAGLKGR